MHHGRRLTIHERRTLALRVVEQRWTISKAALGGRGSPGRPRRSG